jgi:hypothetical protein
MLADLGGFYEIAWLGGTLLSIIFIKQVGEAKAAQKMYKKATDEGKDG